MNKASGRNGIFGIPSCNLHDDMKEGEKIVGLKEVLIVDDEEPLLLTIAEGLSIYKQYFNLHTATNGADAVKLLKSLPRIDLVVTDLSMPKMDGFELLAYMNRNYPHVPVVLMTAFGTPKIEEIVNSMGIFRYLEKPLDINSIAENIFAALSSQAVASASKAEEPQNHQQNNTGCMEESSIESYYKKTMPR